MANDLEIQRSSLTASLSPQERTSLLSSAKQHLDLWNRLDPVPPTILSELKIAKAIMDEDLVPATEADLLQAIHPIFVFAQSFNIPVASVENAARFYLEALKSLPARMAETAVRRAMTAHEGWSRIPLPAEVYRTVGEEYARLNTFRSSLGLAIGMSKHAPG